MQTHYGVDRGGRSGHEVYEIDDVVEIDNVVEIDDLNENRPASGLDN